MIETPGGLFWKSSYQQEGTMHLRWRSHDIKLDSSLQRKDICFNDSPSNMIKIAFYFILKDELDFISILFHF